MNCVLKKCHKKYCINVVVDRFPFLHGDLCIIYSFLQSLLCVYTHRICRCNNNEVGPVSVVTMATYPPQHNLSCIKYLVS